jgi:uncharacterized protein YeaO (DUF488 family)
MDTIRVKRAYEPPARTDGARVLVDRLWPRGLARDRARIDAWIKDVAPSDGLRRWFGHDPGKWPEFRRRYRAELARNPALTELKELARSRRTVTLLFAAKDAEHNNAMVLRDVLQRSEKNS